MSIENGSDKSEKVDQSKLVLDLDETPTNVDKAEALGELVKKMALAKNQDKKALESAYTNLEMAFRDIANGRSLHAKSARLATDSLKQELGKDSFVGTE